MLFFKNILYFNVACCNAMIGKVISLVCTLLLWVPYNGDPDANEVNHCKY